MHIYFGKLKKNLFFQQNNWERAKMKWNWDHFFSQKFIILLIFSGKFEIFTNRKKDFKKTNNLIACPKKLLKNF